jgi:hypothetical protein
VAGRSARAVPAEEQGAYPETAVLEPVAGDADAYPPSSGPETTVIPVPRPGSDPETEPTAPLARPVPPDQQRRSQRKPGRHRPRHTLADDIFDLGDDDE